MWVSKADSNTLSKRESDAVQDRTQKQEKDELGIMQRADCGTKKDARIKCRIGITS